MNPDWYNVLVAAGYPTSVVLLDWESYFDVDFSLTKQSTVEHVTDSRFELLGAGVIEVRQPHEAPTPHFWHGEADCQTVIDHLRREYGKELEGCTLVVHNAHFETAVTALRYDIRPRYVVDTIGLHRHWNARASHKLGDIAKELRLSEEKGDTKKFKGWTYRVRAAKRTKKAKGPPKFMPRMTPEMQEELAAYGCGDCRLEWEVFTRLLPKLSNPAVELRVMQHTVDIWTKPLLHVDHAFADSLAERMDARGQEVIAATGHSRAEISGNHSFTALLRMALRAAGDDPDTYFKFSKQGSIPAIAKGDEERDLLLQHPDPTVRSLIEARVGLKTWPSHAKRVRAISAQSKAGGGMMVPLRYHSAHTGRYGGGEGINLQNLPARHPEAIVNEIRGLLIPPPGHALVVVDASQVEARGTSWVAGEEWKLRAFEAIDRGEGQDIYCQTAEQIFGHPVTKADNPAERQVGKTAELAFGYAGGLGAWRKFDNSDKYTDDQVEDFKHRWRARHPATVQFWHDIEAAWALATKFNRTEKVGAFTVFAEDANCTVIELPSGRWLRYHYPKVTGMGRSRNLSCYDASTKSRTHIYGGSLTENVVQALCRDALVEPMLDLHYSSDILIPLTIHDELVAVVPIKRSEAALARMIQALSTSPLWAPGLPLSAAGRIMERYGKE